VSDSPPIGEDTTMRFPLQLKYRFDERRQTWIVLAPERLLLPAEQVVEILKRIGGTRTVDAIIDELAGEFDAPRDEIAGEVLAIVQDLVDKKVLAR
jgi:pyrroloquinoline quinone biosynthesis protein D